MNLYKKHTHRELSAVLNQSAKLTYDAQRNLLQELKTRAMGVSTAALEAQIREQEEAILNLAYLKDLGFVCREEGQVITVKRTTWAIVMDVIAILMGLALFVVGLVFFWLMFSMFFGDNEFSLTKLFSYTLAITAGMIGFKMLGGIHRFLDYVSFTLVQSGSMITLDKGGISGTQHVPLDALTIEEQDGELILFAAKIEIMRCTEDNLVHKKTLEALRQKMMDNQ